MVWSVTLNQKMLHPFLFFDSSHFLHMLKKKKNPWPPKGSVSVSWDSRDLTSSVVVCWLPAGLILQAWLRKKNPINFMWNCAQVRVTNKNIVELALVLLLVLKFCVFAHTLIYVYLNFNIHIQCNLLEFLVALKQWLSFQARFWQQLFMCNWFNFPLTCMQTPQGQIWFLTHGKITEGQHVLCIITAKRWGLWIEREITNF